MEVGIVIFSVYWFGRVSVLTFDKFRAFNCIEYGGRFEELELILDVGFKTGNKAVEDRVGL